VDGMEKESKTLLLAVRFGKFGGGAMKMTHGRLLTIPTTS